MVPDGKALVCPRTAREKVEQRPNSGKLVHLAQSPAGIQENHSSTIVPPLRPTSGNAAKYEVEQP